MGPFGCQPLHINVKILNEVTECLLIDYLVLTFTTVPSCIVIEYFIFSEGSTVACVVPYSIYTFAIVQTGVGITLIQFWHRREKTQMDNTTFNTDTII